MAQRILMEDLYLTVFAPHNLPEQEHDAIRQTLDDPRFHARLRRAVRGVVRRHPSLTKVKITVTH